MSTSGRLNQRLRTRKDLLGAASRLLKEGRSPSMAEVADEAMVSRATAYRYFPSLDELLCEAPLDAILPDPKDLFGGDDSTDAEARIEKAGRTINTQLFANKHQLRKSVGHALLVPDTGDERAVPVRQNRRTPLIEEALAPVAKELGRARYETLKAALALVIGSESVIVFNDVLHLEEREAHKVSIWAARALVRAALEEARAGPPKSSRKKR